MLQALDGVFVPECGKTPALVGSASFCWRFQADRDRFQVTTVCGQEIM
jgi:hypothetical protein